MPNQMPIPTDWNEEENGYALYMVCGPNSDMWRRNVKGALYALTRGRNYDFDTGIFKNIEQIANRMDDTFMACSLDEILIEIKNLVRVGRMINASLHGEAINFDSEPDLPNAINYEGIAPILKGLGAKIDGGLTLDQIIALMEEQDDETYGFKDWLEILLLLKEIFPDAGSLPMGMIGNLWRSINAARITHNTLTIQAYQATALRGIQNAISPSKDEATEESFVKGLLSNLDKMPWLTTMVASLIDPSPTGETAMAIKLGLAAKNIVGKLFEWLPNWWNSWINTVANPQPQGTVVGMLSEISRKIQSLTDEETTPSVTISNRLKLIADSIGDIEIQGDDTIPILTEIATILEKLPLPDGTTWLDIFGSLEETIGESMPVINVNCATCGGSGCSDCGGQPPGTYGPGVGGPSDTPPSSVPPSGFPPTFPGIPEYNDYKCKAANTIVLNFAEMLFQLSQQENVNLSQYPDYESARKAIVSSLTIATSGVYQFLPDFYNWITHQIMSFVWPYPNEDNIGLAIFEGIRLEWLIDQQDNVCGLYNSSDTGVARLAMTDVVDGYIDATSYSSSVKDTAKEMYKAMLSNQFLGRLFVKDSFIESASSSGFLSCETCTEGDILMYFSTLICTPTFSNETGHFFDNVPLTVTSCDGPAFGDNRSIVQVLTNPPFENINRQVTIISVSGLTDYFIEAAVDGVPSWNDVKTAAEMTGFTFVASHFAIASPTVNDETVFTVELKAEIIP